MRDWLAACVATLCAGGCSFIYNPNNIDKTGDGGTHPADVEKVVDVNPSALTLTSVYPTTIYEGVGFGNSLPALVVVRGEEIPATATVTVTPDAGPTTQIDVRGIEIAGDHRWIAVSIAVPVDGNQDETGAHMVAGPLSLTITVDNNAGVTKTLNGLQVQFLDQLTTPITAPPADTKRYSQINVTAANPFAASMGVGAIHLHSESSIVFGAGITADGSNNLPGPGGCAGGAANSAGAASTFTGGTCSSGKGMSGGGGGGGGHAMAGNAGTHANLGVTMPAGGLAEGAIQIPQLSLDVGGGGGGGGVVGGGGGGTIYLEAGGDLNVTGLISANGAKGANGDLINNSGGGGGAGGTVLLKAGGTLSVGVVTVTGGAASANSNGNGGSGSDGRVRFDAANGTLATAGFQGASFKVVPFYSEVPKVSSAISVVGPAGAGGFTGQAYDSSGAAPADGGFVVAFGTGGVAMPMPMLSPGYNLICVNVPGGNVIAHGEGGMCAEIAYLPPGS